MKTFSDIIMGKRKGQAAVEFVISALVFFVLLLLFIQFGVIFFRQAWLDFLAREASREAAVAIGNNPGGWVDDVTNYVNNRITAGGMTAGNLHVSVSTPTTDQVKVDLTYDQDIPLPFSQNPEGFQLKASSQSFNESASGQQ
jgi:Flp pilus assembly protein TadG